MTAATTILRLTARHRFDWRRLIFSHGWVYLAPFEWSDEHHTLSRPLRLPSGRSVRVTISPALRAKVDAKIRKSEESAIVRQAGTAPNDSDRKT